MKKIVVFSILIACISLQVTGCGKEKEEVTKNVDQNVETTAKKSEKDIRKMAYQSLIEDMKKTVINWETAKIEEYKSTTDHSIWNSNGSINIKDKDTYRVVFTTNTERELGPITIYVDKNDYSILGYDLRN